MAFIAPLIGAVAAGKSLFDSFKKPKMAGPTPNMPEQQASAQQAQVEVAKRRRANLLRGGNTDITRGGGLVPGINVGTKSLLGA